MNRFKIILYCFFLTILSTKAKAADGTFEDAELVNEFITMSISSSHPYDLRHTIPGEPDIDYPIYSAVPRTNFDCSGRHEGYYADIETRCQVFRICANTDLIGRGFAFLCPNGTLFSQKNFVCDWYRNVDCSDSERYYSKNDGNRIGTKTQIMETVRQMMEHPMKTITIALNRDKPITPLPLTNNNSGTSTTNDSRIFRATPAPIRNVPSQEVLTRRQPITLHQIENAAGITQTYQQNQPRGGVDVSDSSPAEGVRSTQTSYTTVIPPTLRFSPTTEASLTGINTFNNPSPSRETTANTLAAPTITSTPLFTTESTADQKEVYVSNLGELSTDPGANFNPQTARIIAEPTSNSVDVKITSESGSLKPNKMNFAEKVNAGLNGVQVVNRNEIIAPEYVQNILHQNVPTPQKDIQPPSYAFASNINSLLDEVAYEAELEGQNSMQVQLRTPSDGVEASTRKPFRFLSRGFSYENTKEDGSYVYGPPTASRSALPKVQHSSSTQSYRNSLFTTSLLTSPAPVSSTEAAHISAFENVPTEPSSFLKPKLETSSYSSGRATNDLIQRGRVVKKQSGTKIGLAEGLQKNAPIIVGSETESESNTKPAIKREQKQLEGQEGNSSPDSKDLPQEPEVLDKANAKPQEPEVLDKANSKPQESEVLDKANANKQAEKLLVAGVQQTILGDLNENKDDIEETSPIVPLYIRSTESQTTTQATSATITKSTTPLPATTTASTTPVTISSTTPLSTTTITPTPPTTTTQSIRRYTVNSVHRRQSSRPIAYTKRQNLVRSSLRTTSGTTSTTTPRPTVKFGLGVRSTSTPVTTTTTTTKATATSRKRPTVSRFSFGSRRRGTVSTSSTSTTTTTAAPSKKLAVRSSDKEISDLTAVASTYNAAPKRDYNSIRQNSYKYTQTQRRRPTHKANIMETTTTSTSTMPATSTTTQQPRRSSSLPTPTLAPFSHDALFSLSTTSTTPEPLPATYLSFNDLTKAIIDDSILQTFRRNQDNSGSTLRPSTVKSQHAPARPQLPPIVTTTPRIQERTTKRTTTVPPTTKAPHVPLKEFIVSKFGAHYSPAPPIVSTTSKPVPPTLAPIKELPKLQKQPSYASQYPIKQNTVRPVVAINPAPVQQKVVQQQQNQEQKQQQEQKKQEQQQKLKQQQQQQQLQQQLLQQQQHQQQQLQQHQQLQQQQNQQLQQQQLRQQQQQQLQQQLQLQQQQQQIPQQQYYQLQQQVIPLQQYVQYQQLIPTIQPLIYRQLQSVQLLQPGQQLGYRFPVQQQIVQRAPIQQQQQRSTIQQGQQIHQRTIPAVQQQQQVSQVQQFQRNPQVQQPQLQRTVPQQQQVPQVQQLQQFQRNQQVQQPQPQRTPLPQQQSQIQIFPSQMTASQTISAQNPNSPSSSNILPEIGSINVRLPTNLAGLIPNTNTLTNSNESLGRAQKRIDLPDEDTDSGRETKSVYSGVSSYDVPLNSVGRLANDITHLLRRIRRL